MFDGKEFIMKEFGGPTEAAEKLRAHGYDVPDLTVQKWCERNSIPGKRLAALVAILTEQSKGRFDINNYFSGSKTCTHSAKKPNSSGKPLDIFG